MMLSSKTLRPLHRIGPARGRSVLLSKLSNKQPPRHRSVLVQRNTASTSNTAGSVGVVDRPPELPASQQEHQQQQQQQGPEGQFNWLRNWWPVMAEEMLHKDKPVAVTILGRDLVVWWNRLEAKWVVMQDSCPHRLAPLSLGHVSKDGSELTCSYHGWQFNSQGSCTSIPQIEGVEAGDAAPVADAEQLHMAEGLRMSKRTCVQAFPSRTAKGLVFVWLDMSPEGLEASKLSSPEELTKAVGASTSSWAVSQLHNDYRYWMEQAFDPSHANFLHVSEGMFKIEDAVPMKAQSVSSLSLEKGFEWQHEGYEKKNVAMRATRAFTPPCMIKTDYKYPGGSGLSFLIFVVPVGPGTSRTFFNAAPLPSKPAGAGSETSKPEAGKVAAAAAATDKGGASNLFGSLPAAFLRNLMAGLPHYVLQPQNLLDDDTVMMHQLEVAVRASGATDKDYTLATQADGGVAAIGRWIRMAGYEEMWQRMFDSTGRTVPPAVPKKSVEELLDRRFRHVDHCAVCQKADRQMGRVEKVVNAVAFVAAAVASGLLAVALMAVLTAQSFAPAGGFVPGLLVSAVALGAKLLASKINLFRQDKFVTGMRRWRKVGGLSMVRE